ncbi:hypothetical protein AHAS_Ahas14G0197900 [Arachis hypogaea]
MPHLCSVYVRDYMKVATMLVDSAGLSRYFNGANLKALIEPGVKHALIVGIAIQEKIEAHSRQQAAESTISSPLDALEVVLGKEHPGLAFKSNTTRISQMNLGSSNDTSTSFTCGPNV